MTQKHRAPSYRLPAALLIGIVLVICLFSGLSAIGLVGPDEPRYAWIAQHMAMTGDWLTPKLYGQPWFEKPVLYYWAAAVGFKFLHSSEYAARLPSAFAALVAAIAMAALGYWRYGRRTARATLLIFPTSVGVIAFARAAGPDMLFSAALSLALLSAVSILEKRGAFGIDPLGRIRNDKLDLILLGVWLGLATLAKGPAALVLAGGSVLLWAIATNKLKIAVHMLHPLAVLFFVVVALPWYVLCARANSGFLHVFIVQHNFQRYLTPVFQHRQPFWFFGPIILLGLLPWSALLVGAAFDARRIFRDGSWRASPGFFIACWAIFPAIFFSFSQSKLPEYILPVFPPLAVLLAHSFVCAIDHAPRKAQWMGVATGTMWVVLGVAGAVGFHRLPAYAPFNHQEVIHLAVASLLIGIIAGVAIELMSLWRKLWLVIAFTALVSVCVVVAANLRVLPQLDPLLSARPLAREIRATIAPPADIYSAGDINRTCDYGLRFYLDRTSLPQFDPHLFSRENYVLVSPGGDMELNDLGIIHRKMLARFLPYCWVESVKPKTTH
ncbi:MAG: glycosyltransferase family 39 protein [Candidatus Acidiferrales bacterium]